VKGGDVVTGIDAEAAARARLDLVFSALDRLTPDELGHVGLRRQDGHAYQELIDTIEAAARASDRSVLMGEARTLARETVLRRYAEGSFHATYVGLNWGLSQGTTEDRVAIAEAVADAAAAAVVADLVDPEVVEALSMDISHVADLSTNDASEGSLDRPLRGRSPLSVIGALTVGALVFAVGVVLVHPLVGLVGGAVAVVIELAIARRPRGAAR
jgi:hypothetical protein